MAGESVDLPVTAEVTKSCGVELRRTSVGKASYGNSEEKVVPHYLRASTGSCHDFCKFGRKHAFEVDKRHSIRKRATKKPLHQSSEESIGATMMSVSKPTASVDFKPTKMSMVELRESGDSQLQISDNSDTNKQELPTKSPVSHKQTRSEVLVGRNSKSLVKVKSLLLPKSHISSISQTRRHEISSTCQVETPSKSTSNKVKTLAKSTTRKVETPSKSSSKMVKIPPKSTSKKVETSSELSSIKDKEMELSEKLVISLHPNSVTMKTLSSLNSSEGFGEIKMENRESSSKVTSRAPLSPKYSLRRFASINARNHKSLKIASHLKNQPKPRKAEPKEHNNEVEEKTLYVIKMESGNNTLQSDQNPSQDIESSLSQSSSSPKFSSSSISQSSSQEHPEESEYAISEFEEDSFSGNHETKYIENGETIEVKENGKPCKDVIVYAEENDCQTLKLKFITGKLVESQIEKSSPRRHKFQKEVLLENAADGKAEAQSESFERKDGVGADGIGATTDPEKVVLRHGDLQGKKDGQGLLNNLIEETASKLVETRKSKVQALVGAFETVISLQVKNTLG